MLRTIPGRGWTAAAKSLCWLAEQNLQAGALKLSPAALRGCEGIGSRFAGTAVAIFDGHASAEDGELRRSLLLKSVELHFETAQNTATVRGRGVAAVLFCVLFIQRGREENLQRELI